MKGDTTARILRKIANAIEGMSDIELESFFNSISLSTRPEVPRTNRNAKRKKQSFTKLGSSLSKEILEQISNSPTREIGFDILEKQGFTRTELASLARRREIHINRDDKAERIKEKIIESTIGSRLRSNAIRRG